MQEAGGEYNRKNFFTKVTTRHHEKFDSGQGLSFLKRRCFSPLDDLGDLNDGEFIPRNLFLEPADRRWERVDEVVGGRIKEIELPFPEFFRLSLSENYEILARMIQYTALKQFALPGDPPELGRLAKPGSFGQADLDGVLENAMQLFIDQHAWEFWDTMDLITYRTPHEIMRGDTYYPNMVSYIWITFWNIATAQDLFPPGHLPLKMFGIASLGERMFENFAKRVPAWDRLYGFLASVANLPGQIYSFEMESFEQLLASLGDERGGVQEQLSDFARSVLDIFNEPSGEILATLMPAFWYSTAIPTKGQISPHDLRPFYEMFLMFSRTRPIDILVKVMSNPDSLALPEERESYLCGGFRYTFTQTEPAGEGMDTDTAKFMKKFLRVNQEPLKSGGKLATISYPDQNTQPDVEVESGIFSLVGDKITASQPRDPTEDGNLAFFKKPRIQNVYLLRSVHSPLGVHANMRINDGAGVNLSTSQEPGTLHLNGLQFPKQVIVVIPLRWEATTAIAVISALNATNGHPGGRFELP